MGEISESDRFDLWLERALARELGRDMHCAPAREWTRPRRRSRRGLRADPDAGGALALTGAPGLGMAAVAAGLQGPAAIAKE